MDIDYKYKLLCSVITNNINCDIFTEFFEIFFGLKINCICMEPQ